LEVVTEALVAQLQPTEVAHPTDRLSRNSPPP
jgi:hypothetical protein